MRLFAPRQKNQSSEAGFNLIEAAIVLGIVGLVIGGIWAAASSTYKNMKIQDSVKGLLSTAQALKANYTNVPSSTTIDAVEDLITLGVFPKDWVKGTIVCNPFSCGSSSTITVAGDVAGAEIAFTGLDKDSCASLAIRVANSNAGSLLTSVAGAGTAVTVGAATAAEAATTCSTASGNTLTFTFNLTQ